MQTETAAPAVLTTPAQIHAFRALTIYRGLKLEVQTNGTLRLTRGVSCFALAKREFGLKGNRAKVLADLKAALESQYGIALS